MIIEKVRISLAETTNPDAREKLQWLQGEVEAGASETARFSLYPLTSSGRPSFSCAMVRPVGADCAQALYRLSAPAMVMRFNTTNVEPRKLLFPPLDGYSFDLIERNFVAGAVIELGGARAFVRGHGLRVLERPAGLEIRGDPCGAKSMAADPNSHPEIGGAALNHAPGVDAVHRLIRRRVGAAGGRAEQGTLAVVADAGGLDVGIKVRLRL